MVTANRRRWFRFSLRTMLVLVTLVCVYFAWVMKRIATGNAIVNNGGEESMVGAKTNGHLLAD